MRGRAAGTAGPNTRSAGRSRCWDPAGWRRPGRRAARGAELCHTWPECDDLGVDCYLIGLRKRFRTPITSLSLGLSRKRDASGPRPVHDDASRGVAPRGRPTTTLAARAEETRCPVAGAIYEVPPPRQGLPA